MVEERWRKEKAKKKNEKTRKMWAKIWPPTLKVTELLRQLNLIELLSQLNLIELTQSLSIFFFPFLLRKNHEDEKGRINFHEIFWSGLRIKDSISNFQSKTFVSNFKIPYSKFQILNLKFQVSKSQIPSFKISSCKFSKSQVSKFQVSSSKIPNF